MSQGRWGGGGGCTPGLWHPGTPMPECSYSLLGEEQQWVPSSLSKPAPSLPWWGKLAPADLDWHCWECWKAHQTRREAKAVLGFFLLGPNPWLCLNKYQILRIQRQGNLVGCKLSSIALWKISASTSWCVIFPVPVKESILSRRPALLGFCCAVPHAALATTSRDLICVPSWKKTKH